MGLYRETDFATLRDENHLGIPTGGIREDVGAASNPRRWSVLGSVQGRQRLTRQGQHGWLVAQLHDVAVGFDNLVRISRTKCDKARDGPQGRKLFYRLVCRSILSIALCSSHPRIIVAHPSHDRRGEIRRIAKKSAAPPRSTAKCDASATDSARPIV